MILLLPLCYNCLCLKTTPPLQFPLESPDLLIETFPRPGLTLHPAAVYFMETGQPLFLWPEPGQQTGRIGYCPRETTRVASRQPLALPLPESRLHCAGPLTAGSLHRTLTLLDPF